MNVLTTLYRRQPVLSVYGFVLIAASLACLIPMAFDPRQLDGVNVWVKPAKFFLSVGIFSLTSAWFFGYVRPERRSAPWLRYVVIATLVFGTFEDVWIVWQAAHGLRSHFNIGTPFYAVMYALMGIGAALLVTTTLPLAWEIARRPVPELRADYVAAVVAGLVLTGVMGTWTGMLMGGALNHSFGAEGGQLTVFGWNRSGGDGRVAHFFAIHAEQALPLLLAILAPLPKTLRWLGVVLAGAAVTALTVATALQAQAGQPFLPGIG